MDESTPNTELIEKFRLLAKCGESGSEIINKDWSDSPLGDIETWPRELGAAVLADAIGRLIPGVLNDGTSALTDSFQDNLLAPPVYTRPEIFRGWKVPDILLSGNHAKIEEWRYDKAVEITQQKRPDLG